MILLCVVVDAITLIVFMNSRYHAQRPAHEDPFLPIRARR